MPEVRRVVRRSADGDAPRSRPRDEEPEEEAPRRGRAPVEDPEPEESPRGRRRPAEEEEPDDDPADGGKGSVRKGWGGYRTNKEKGSDFADELKITSEAELVKFLEDEPVVSYRQHWIDSPPNGIKKRSWICIEDDCPLCEMGDRPRLLTVFNVLHMSGGGDPENKVLMLGTKAAGQLENFAADPKTGPLGREDVYWSISKSGKGSSTAYNFQSVKERDLKTDWKIEPLSDDELAAAEAGCYDETVVQTPTRKQLREIATGLADDD